MFDRRVERRRSIGRRIGKPIGRIEERDVGVYIQKIFALYLYWLRIYERVKIGFCVKNVDIDKIVVFDAVSPTSEKLWRVCSWCFA